VFANVTTERKVTDRNRWIALYVLCVGMPMIVLDVTVVDVALPSIQDDLDFSQSSLAWVVSAHLIAFGSLLAGRLGELISRRDVFLAALGVFTVASLLCGVAQSQEVLVAAHFVQGVGGAMPSAVILGMIVTMFPEPRERAKAARGGGQGRASTRVSGRIPPPPARRVLPDGDVTQQSAASRESFRDLTAPHAKRKTPKAGNARSI